MMYVKCAFNQWANKSKCVGYCNNHKCYLTKLHLKNMHCLQKRCKYLERLEHSFWEARKKRGKIIEIYKEKSD